MGEGPWGGGVVLLTVLILRWVVPITCHSKIVTVVPITCHSKL